MGRPSGHSAPLPVTAAVICDEQLLFGEAFAEALRRAGVDAVATAHPDDVPAALDSTDLPLVVVNVQPAPVSPLLVVEKIRSGWPQARLVCLGAELPEVAQSCIEAGADLLLSKRRPLQDLVETVLAPPAAAHRSPGRGDHEDAVRWIRGRPAEPPLAARFLTRRERDVLRLLVAAESTRDIARSLGITVPTARGYIQSTFTKLGVHSRVEAVTYAVVHSVVEI